MTHYYVRHGTTSLVAAFDFASGSVIAHHYRRILLVGPGEDGAPAPRSRAFARRRRALIHKSQTRQRARERRAAVVTHSSTHER
jgi:hypothetical protein